MAKKLIILMILTIILSSSSILASDLSNFQKSFIKNKEFNVVGVIGAKAQDLDVLAILGIFDTLTESYNISWRTKGCPEGYVCTNPPTPPYEISLDKDISNISKNIISVGGPCANNITAQIMDLPTTWPECADEFENGSGRIVLYNKWNHTQLVIAGFSAEDTKKASRVLADYGKLNLTGNEILVTGDLDKPVIIKITEKYNKWYDEENRRTNFSHPYIKWAIDKKGSGTFTLYITTKPDILIKGKMELHKFGDVGSFSCSESTNRCYVYLKINDFDDIKRLLRISYVEGISIEMVSSDYKLNISLDKIKECNKDEECTLVSNSCCSNANCDFESINRKYRSLWNTKIYCRGIACIQRICMNIGYSKCINNQCTRVVN